MVGKAEKGREGESREVKVSHGHLERREKGMRGGVGGRQESKRGRREQTAPFIVGQAYLAVAR